VPLPATVALLEVSNGTSASAPPFGHLLGSSPPAFCPFGGGHAFGAGPALGVVRTRSDHETNAARGGRVVDPVNGRDGEFDVLIDGDRIAAVGRNLPVDAEVSVVDTPTQRELRWMIDSGTARCSMPSRSARWN